MAKFKLSPDPTFAFPVKIPVPGGEAASVLFTFKYRTQSEMKAWGESLGGKDNADAIMEMVVGWELDDPFNRESVIKLCDSYGGASGAILETYLREIHGARVKN